MAHRGFATGVLVFGLAAIPLSGQLAVIEE